MIDRSCPGADFWRGKRVLLTGHSGFKGSWLTLWLHHLGAEVSGISLAPNTTPNLFTLSGIDNLCHSHFGDVRDPVVTNSLIADARPEIVFHLAAQPLVRASYADPLTTFSTNRLRFVLTINTNKLIDIYNRVILRHV